MELTRQRARNGGNIRHLLSVQLKMNKGAFYSSYPPVSMQTNELLKQGMSTLLTLVRRGGERIQELTLD